MDRASIISALRRHEAELRALGLSRLSLFGSFARGDADERSDIDLLSSLDNQKNLSLLDVVHIENRLTDLLGRKVDLVPEDCLDPRVRPEVQKSLIHAF